MTDKIEQKVVDMLDALQKGAVEVGGEVVKYSPDVADAVLWVVRIDGVQSVVMGVVSAIAAYIFWILTKRVWKWIKEDDSGGEPIIVLPFILFIGTVVFAVSQVFSVWNWIAIIEPKLWLAKQIMQSVTGA